jgi:methylase of polypeptide subunit release factors
MRAFPTAARVSIAVARNREPILAVLKRILPARGLVLEIASGTGEHGVYFAAALPHLTWQPSDHDPDALTASRHTARRRNCRICWLPSSSTPRRALGRSPAPTLSLRST